jgi:hypothetical protein
MKSIVVGILAIVLVLSAASTASAAYGYVTTVNPGSVAYVGYYPGGMTYVYPSYAYPMAVGRFAARPVVTAVPVAAPAMIESYPTVVEPVVTVPGPVVYPAPVLVTPRYYVPGQPVRNLIRASLP